MPHAGRVAVYTLVIPLYLIDVKFDCGLYWGRLDLKPLGPEGGACTSMCDGDDYSMYQTKILDERPEHAERHQENKMSYFPFS